MLNGSPVSDLTLTLDSFRCRWPGRAGIAAEACVLHPKGHAFSRRRIYCSQFVFALDGNCSKPAENRLFGHFVRVCHHALQLRQPIKGYGEFRKPRVVRRKRPRNDARPPAFSRIADLQGSKPKTSQSPDCACRIPQRSDIDWPKLDINEKNFGQKYLKRRYFGS